MKPIDLVEHPEGGRFRRVFRSNVMITRGNGEVRSALTHIYFSLAKNEVSRFHKVESDEVWNLYQGTGLYLYTWDGITAPERHEISARNNKFCHVVHAGIWQAAEPIDEEILVGCSVGPGFEFSDFELLDSTSKLTAIIHRQYPNLSKFTFIEK
ncbi:MAG: cupin domain-containing protein [Desulfotalea sp.]